MVFEVLNRYLYSQSQFSVQCTMYIDATLKKMIKVSDVEMLATST